MKQSTDNRNRLQDGLLELGGDHVANVKKNIEAAANQLVDQLHKGKGKTASTPPPSDVPSTPTLQPSMTPPSSTPPAALLPSTLTLTATPARGVATETVTLLVTLRSGAPGMPPLAGKTISVDFGDGSRKRRQLLAATVTTDANGQATFTHAYLTAQTYNVTAHFAGESVSPQFLLASSRVPVILFGYCVKGAALHVTTFYDSLGLRVLLGSDLAAAHACH